MVKLNQFLHATPLISTITLEIQRRSRLPVPLHDPEARLPAEEQRGRVGHSGMDQGRPGRILRRARRGLRRRARVRQRALQGLPDAGGDGGRR